MGGGGAARRPVDDGRQGRALFRRGVILTQPRDQRPGGFIVWLTGLSGAGKTTLARALRQRLAGCGPVEVLDGDEMRTTLCKGLGFSREDRDANVSRIGYVAALLARHGVMTIVSAISPYRNARDEIRGNASAQGTPFVEVYLDVPLDTLITRDVKGLYRKALAGELAHFTGVSDPYEAPLQPEVIVHTGWEPVEASADTILTGLADRGLIIPVRDRMVAAVTT
jgi:adenylylsulfate kinase